MQSLISHMEWKFQMHYSHTMVGEVAWTLYKSSWGHYKSCTMCHTIDVTPKGLWLRTDSPTQLGSRERQSTETMSLWFFREKKMHKMHRWGVEMWWWFNLTQSSMLTALFEKKWASRSGSLPSKNLNFFSTFVEKKCLVWTSTRHRSCFLYMHLPLQTKNHIFHPWVVSLAFCTSQTHYRYTTVIPVAM